MLLKPMFGDHLKYVRNHFILWINSIKKYKTFINQIFTIYESQFYDQVVPYPGMSWPDTKTLKDNDTHWKWSNRFSNWNTILMI